MLTQLTVENFRGFRVFDVTTERVTAFMGPNSSGKTTALHAVRFAMDALELALESEHLVRLQTGSAIIVVAENLVVDARRLLAVSDWRALFLDQRTSTGTTLTVRLGFETGDPIQALMVKLACASNEQVKLTVQVESETAVAPLAEGRPALKLVNKQLRAFLQRHAPRAVFMPPFYGAARSEEYRTRAVVDRMLGSGDQSHVVRNLVLQLDPPQFDRLNAFLRDATGAILVTRTTADQAQLVTELSVTFRDTNGELELSAAGAGLVNLIALYSGLSRWSRESADRTVIFLLDEPEAHLHPRLQADMSERLARLVTEDFGAQLLMATHSVDILNRLASSGGAIVRCDRQATVSAVSLTSNAALFDDVADWVDLTPYTAINLLASRRVVFCEGDDEVKVLPRLAELLYRNNPARWSAFRRWSLVRLEGASNAPIAGLLRRLVESDAVRAGVRDADFHIELVLDRDYQRTPGLLEDLDSVGIKQRTTVWSQHSLESLLVEPSVLQVWCRTFLGDKSPADLRARIADAVSAADTDQELNDYAIRQLTGQIWASDVLDDHGNARGGVNKVIRSQERAVELVRNDPRTWQRGKDRARRVLGYLRDSLPAEARNQFPTDVIRLVQKTSLDLIADPRAAVPQEAQVLLDRLAAR